MAVDIVMYESPACPYCRAAKQLLAKKSAQYKSIVVDTQAVFDEMVERSGRESVPQIFIGERHVGGYDDMIELDMDDELDPLLTA